MTERQGAATGLEARGGLSLSEAVYASLRKALRTGVYRSGDRLREDEVAVRLKVSRTPVREALGRLVAKGLLEPSGGRGLIVRRLAMPEILELYAMREILEGAAARLAAQHASPPEVMVLRDLLVTSRNTSESEELARLNRTFHNTIIGAAHNRYLEGALEELQDTIALLGGTTFAVSGRPTDAGKEHRTIVDAIAVQNPGEAEEAARAHIRQALRARLKLLSS